MPVFPVIAMQRFDFKNNITAIKRFLVMILNLYLTSQQSQSKKEVVKSDFVVVCFKCFKMINS